jgi:adenylate cyclase
MLGLAANEPGLMPDERRWRRETRSAWLRLVALVVLIVNLMVGEHGDDLLVHAHVVVGYALTTFLALGLATTRRGPTWTATAFVVIDAVLVVALFHAHLFAPTITLSHSLTTATLAIGFLLLTHVALRLKPSLVLLFSSLVIGGWLLLLTSTVAVHTWQGTPTERDWPAILIGGSLAAAFGFAAYVCYLLTTDHNVLLKEAATSEKRRRNLARFFSPGVLSELQAAGTPLTLRRRRAAVMFVDLRSFTRLSETTTPEDVAGLLAEYRQLVTQTVFTYEGTIDKFIGDGVMAVFGQPDTAPADTDRGLRCALHLAASLAGWKETRLREDKPAPDAGIGLHVGPVIGGVLESGSHDEFTVIGDAVNVAERLERLSSELAAAVVVSDAVIREAASFQEGDGWKWMEAAELEGRSGRLRIAYLPRVKKPAVTNEQAKTLARRPEVKPRVAPQWNNSRVERYVATALGKRAGSVVSLKIEGVNHRD